LNTMFEKELPKYKDRLDHFSTSPSWNNQC
jgi:hypothetical protein